MAGLLVLPVPEGGGEEEEETLVIVIVVSSFSVPTIPLEVLTGKLLLERLIKVTPPLRSLVVGREPFLSLMTVLILRTGLSVRGGP